MSEVPLISFVVHLLCVSVCACGAHQLIQFHCIHSVVFHFKKTPNTVQSDLVKTYIYIKKIQIRHVLFLLEK